MSEKITGLHHITALSADAQKNVDFYAGILGLRMIKKTINFDAPDVYHLYYGDESGAPGTIMTFFPYPGIAKGARAKGK
jgi:glyoxalase family protein